MMKPIAGHRPPLNQICVVHASRSLVGFRNALSGSRNDCEAATAHAMEIF